MSSLPTRMVRPLARFVHRLLKRRRPPRPGSGAHALALTAEGQIILVRLRYASGWRLPGGGRDNGESMEAAALRELREEIGMTGHGRVRPSSVAGVVIVEDVRYTPRRWSWEVERVCEASPDDLPPDLSQAAAGWLTRLRAHI